MTSSDSDPIKKGVFIPRTQSERSETEEELSSSEYDVSSVGEINASLTITAPSTIKPPVTAFSTRLELDTYSLSEKSSESEEETGPLHLRVRETGKKGSEELLPFYRFQGKDGKWQVLSTRIKTPNGIFLIPQTKEHWEKTKDQMMGVKTQLSKLESKLGPHLDRGFTVDFTYKSLILTDTKHQQHAFVYSKYPSLQTHINTMQNDIKSNVGITFSEKDTVRPLKKRDIKVYNEISDLEKTAKALGKFGRGVKKVGSSIADFFSKKPKAEE